MFKRKEREYSWPTISNSKPESVLDSLEKSFLRGFVNQAREILRSKKIEGTLQEHQKHEADLKAVESLLSKLGYVEPRADFYSLALGALLSGSYGLTHTEFLVVEKKDKRSKK